MEHYPVKVNKHGQVIIPKVVRDRFGLTKGTDIDFIDEGHGVIRLVKRSEGDGRATGSGGTIQPERPDRVKEV